MVMNCPQCEKEMRPVDEPTMAARQCGHCRGIWFVGDADTAPSVPLSRQSSTGVKAWADPSRFDIRETTLHCPQCATEALRAVVDRHSNARASICAQCRGMWLPASHYEKLVRALAGSAETDAAPYKKALPHRRGSENARSAESAAVPEQWHEMMSYLETLAYRILEENPKLRKLMEGLERSLPL